MWFLCTLIYFVNVWHFQVKLQAHGIVAISSVQSDNSYHFEVNFNPCMMQIFSSIWAFCISILDSCKTKDPIDFSCDKSSGDSTPDDTTPVEKWVCTMPPHMHMFISLHPDKCPSSIQLAVASFILPFLHYISKLCILVNLLQYKTVGILSKPMIDGPIKTVNYTHSLGYNNLSECSSF